MDLFKLLQTFKSDFIPSSIKIHLAIWNGFEKPLDVYLAGEFEEWQTWQNKRNFERSYIISLVQLSETDKWLFTGAYESHGNDYIEEKKIHKYRTTEIDEFSELSGRLIVQFKRTGRASYLLAENWADQMLISEIKPEKMVVESFRSYSNTSVDKPTLDIIVKQAITSWKSALSSVSGIYLITDKASGKLYVGSASGEGGLWQRWSDYSANGHGGNKKLVKLLKDKGNQYSDNFSYSILEIADTHVGINTIIARESYWKEVLCSREHGYNSN
jgi:hypothetical protein